MNLYVYNRRKSCKVRIPEWNAKFNKAIEFYYKYTEDSQKPPKPYTSEMMMRCMFGGTSHSVLGGEHWGEIELTLNSGLATP